MKNSIPLVKSLLPRLKLVEYKYQETSKATAQDFNIFRTLNIGHLETSVHSKFIAYLLNPDSDHAQGDTFLKLFTEELSISNFKTENASVEIEKYTGDGFIDIYICEGGEDPRLIVIENKIYAGDQPKQLERYYKYAKTKAIDEDKINLYYLTLKGVEPGEDSLGSLQYYNEEEHEEKSQVKLLAYQAEMLRWINDCIRETALIPNLREILSQYANLIKILTIGTQNQQYMKELKSELLKTDNYKLLSDLDKVLPQIRVDIQISFWQRLEELCKEKGYLTERSPNDTSISDNVNNYYYKSKGNKHYGLFIKVMDYKDVKLWIRIGIYADGLYCVLETWTESGENIGIKKYPAIAEATENIPEKIDYNKWNDLQWHSFNLNKLNFGTFSGLEYSLHKEENLNNVLESFMEQCESLFSILKTKITPSATV